MHWNRPIGDSVVGEIICKEALSKFTNLHYFLHLNAAYFATLATRWSSPIPELCLLDSFFFLGMGRTAPKWPNALVLAMRILP